MTPKTWDSVWPAELGRAISLLESDIEVRARDLWSSNRLAMQPATTAHQHVLVALAYTSNLNFRLAIREYENILTVSPELSDPHWGIGHKTGH